MNLLLEDRLAPVTTSMGFVETSLSKLVSGVVDWFHEIKVPYEMSIMTTKVSGSLESVIRQLLPLHYGSNYRFLILPTRSSWTAYLENSIRGADGSPISVLARRLKCRSLHIVAEPNTLQKKGKRLYGRQGALILDVFGPDNTHWQNLIRGIRLINDAGKWEFSTSGTPLPFEQLDAYQARKLTDRFTFEMLKTYCNELGLQPFDEDFYLPSTSSSACLIELTGALPSKARTATLEEARKKWMID